MIVLIIGIDDEHITYFVLLRKRENRFKSSYFLFLSPEPSSTAAEPTSGVFAATTGDLPKYDLVIGT